MVHELKQSENEQNRIKMLINVYVSCFISVLSDFIIYETVNEKLEDYSTIPIKYKVIGFIISLILIILVGIIIRISGEKKVFRNLSLQKKKYMMIVSISIPLTILIALIGSISVFDKEKVGFIMGNFFPQIFPLISIILICIIVYDYNKSIEIGAELERQVREKREIDEYSHVIENMYSETRRFKHDYINMLSPLKEYIDNFDIKGLHKFFYENVIDMDSDIKWGSSNIDKLKYIKDTGLKAILSAKLIKALSVNIDIKVEIVDNIPDVSMNIMDLCR